MALSSFQKWYLPDWEQFLEWSTSLALGVVAVIHSLQAILSGSTGIAVVLFRTPGKKAFNGTAVLSVKEEEKCTYFEIHPEHSVLLTKPVFNGRTSLVAQTVKRLLTMRETRRRSLGREDPLEKEMAAHPSTLGWKIPRTEKHGRLQSMGSQRVRHN